MVGKGFLMLSAIVMLLVVRGCFGERKFCIFSAYWCIAKYYCLLRSTPLEALWKQVCELLSGCSSERVPQLCSSLEILLVNCMVLACSLKEKNVHLRIFLEWMVHKRASKTPNIAY